MLEDFAVKSHARLVAAVLYPAAAAAAVMLVASASCNGTHDGKPKAVASEPAAVQPTSRLPSPTTPPPHGLRDEQLRDLMDRIEAKTQKHWPEEVPRPRDDQGAMDLAKAAESAQRLADALATAAERIPPSIEHARLADADRAGFNAAAATLGAQALRLRQAATGRDADGIRQALDGITATCLSCHMRYRDVAGELKVQQVSAPQQRGLRLFVAEAAFQE